MSDLQTEIVQELSERICSEIDFEILRNILVENCGWTKVDLERFHCNEQAVDIINWCHEHTRGRWSRRGTNFVFEDGRDATFFILKWS